METKFSEVANLYLGCECEFNGIRGKMIKVDSIGCILDYNVYSGDHLQHGTYKPILRPLSDASKEELLHVMELAYRDVYGHESDFEMVEFVPEVAYLGLKASEENGRWNYGITISKSGADFSVNGDFMHINQFNVFTYLLKQGFDLFSLLDSNQAIDKTILTKTEV